MNDPEIVRTIKQGVLGLIGTGGGAVISLLEAVEAWLRVASLLVGIAVGLATLYAIIKKQRAKEKV